MSRLCLLCLSLIVIGCSGKKEEERDPIQSAKDEDRIQGTWAIEKAIEEGETVPSEKTEKLSLVITSTQFETRGDEEPEVLDYKIDSSKKPGHIELTSKGEEKKGPPILGLYRFEGDSLEICFNKEGKPDERPEDFTSTKKNGYSVMVLKRRK